MRRDIELAKRLLESKGYKVSKVNESAGNIIRFKVGDQVEYSMLYGGTVYATVISRTKDEITVKEVWTAEDTGEDASAEVSYPVEVDEKYGTERAVIWEYHGEHGYVYPPDYKFNYDESVKESSDQDSSHSSEVYNVLNDLGISFKSISEEDDVIYVENDEPFDQSDLDKVWFKLHNADSAGFEDMNTMWFAFD